MGARATKPGPDATCYPTGIGATPLEILENETPIVFLRRELRPHSGGDGRSRGGDGQIVDFRVNTHRTWLLNAVTTGKAYVADGLAGGEPGSPGHFTINGEDRISNGKVPMQPGDIVHMKTPGGGGYGRPARAEKQSGENPPAAGKKRGAPI
jgi:N-methylhydantoinase B/oxoprolinase/acetone carboxylase alpha subunit